MILSYSAICDFLDCKKKFYYRNIRNLVRSVFNLAIFEGKCIHYGISRVYKKSMDYKSETMEYYKQLLDDSIKSYFYIDDVILKKAREFSVIILPLVESYKLKYQKFIDSVDDYESEIVFKFSLGDIILKGTVDGIFYIGDKIYFHELKSSKHISEEHVRNLRYDFQMNYYNYLFYKINNERVSGYVYDIIRKPSIRKKEKESKEFFVSRLMNYYKEKKDVFFMETYNDALIPISDFTEIIENIVKEIKYCLNNNLYPMNLRNCFLFSKCDYFDLCYFGENEITMKFYQKGERDENKN